MWAPKDGPAARDEITDISSRRHQSLRRNSYQSWTRVRDVPFVLPYQKIVGGGDSYVDQRFAAEESGTRRFLLSTSRFRFCALIV